MAMGFQDFLLLVIDNDLHLYSQISNEFSPLGLKTVHLHSNFSAIDTIKDISPTVVLMDFKIAIENNCEIVRLIDSAAQLLLLATPEDAAEVVKFIENRDCDYIFRPFKIDLLNKRISMMLNGVQSQKEQKCIQEMSDLYIANTQVTLSTDTERLLDVMFDHFMHLSGADNGTLYLLDKEENELVLVRQYGNDTASIRSQTGISKEQDITQKAFYRGEPLLVNAEGSGEFSNLAVPIRSQNDIIGVITLRKMRNQGGFSTEEQKYVEAIATQAGITINHINNYCAINQKLDELMLVSNYSEQLTGLVDKYDIIRALFEITTLNFPIDFLGFLLIQRRTHEFLYWSRGNINEKSLREISKETINHFNLAHQSHIHERRVVIRRMSIGENSPSVDIQASFPFKHIVSVSWDDYKFGTVIFASTKVLQGATEKKTILSSLVSQTRIALTNSKLYSDMKENYIRTIKALAIAVDAKDTYTHGHSENVMNIAEEIAREMGIEEKNIGIIRDAGLLHDIGKIGIPGYILNKPGPLTYEEFNGIMKTHSTLGANIVKDVPFLRDLHKLILYHHEHFDGGGYPDNLKGDQIPIGARILHVADAFEAMTSNRPYRNSLGKKEAVKRLIENSGKQFDPFVIKTFLRLAVKKGWIDSAYFSTLDNI